MKIKSQKIFCENVKVREHVINKFNSCGLIERTDYLDENGLVKFLSEFSYGINRNCILKKEFDDKITIQSFNQWEFDNNNRETKYIELRAENAIWERYEKNYPNDNTIIYISKDETGNINQQTIESTETGK